MMRTFATVLEMMAAPAAVDAQTPPQPSEVAILSEVAAAGDRCGWLDGFQREVVLMSRDTELTRIGAIQGQAGAAAARVEADQATARGQAAVCEVEAARQVRAQVTAIASTHLALWLARAEAYQSLSVTEPWASDITTLNAERETVAAALRPISGQPAYAPIRARAAQEAPVVLAALCPARRTERVVKGPRPCPGSPPPVETTMAVALVEGAETVARRHRVYQAERAAEQEFATPFQPSLGGVFVANFNEALRYRQLHTDRVVAQSNLGQIGVEPIDAQIRAEFSCTRPGRLMFDIGSPSATWQQIGAVEGEGDRARVTTRITAPIRRVGEPGMVARVTATTLFYQNPFTRAMLSSQQEYQVLDWGGPQLGETLLNCPT